jgi:replicative DNA helicase
VCIIATSQFNRSNDDVPTLSSYRGSGEIEENTDIGILMYYPYQQATFEKKQEIKDADKDKIINVAVQKNRIHGLTGTISFEFDPKTMRMKEQNHDM